MTTYIDGFYEGSGKRALRLTVRPAAVGIGIYGPQGLLVSADAYLMVKAILEAANEGKAKRWLAAIGKA